MIPIPGDTVRLTGRCGVQFRAWIRVRVTKVETFTHTPDHMVYLAGYQLDQYDTAVEHRPMLLVEHAGIELLHRPPQPAGKRSHRNVSPTARIPQQRTRQTGRNR